MMNQGKKIKRRLSEMSAFSNRSTSSISSEDSFESIANSSVDFRQKVRGILRRGLAQELVIPPPSAVFARNEEAHEEDETVTYREAAVKIEMWRAQQSCEDIDEFRKLKQQLRASGCLTSAGVTALLDSRAQARLAQFNTSGGI